MAEPQGVQEKSGIACPEARLQESARGTGRLLKLCGIHGFAGQAALGEGKRHSIKVASACSCSPPSPCRSTWPPPSRRLPPSPRTGQDRSRAASASPEAPWPPAAVGLAAGPAWGSGAQAPLGLCPACSRRSGPGREGGREGGPAGLPLCLLLPSSPPCPGGVGLACLQEQRLLGGVCFWSCSLWTVELWRADVAFGSPPLSHSAWVLNGPFGWVSVACGGALLQPRLHRGAISPLCACCPVAWSPRAFPTGLLSPEWCGGALHWLGDRATCSPNAGIPHLGPLIMDFTTAVEIECVRGREGIIIFIES